MNAFVLSGGGNLGAVQAGMLEALLEADIRPDLLVGVSIGAANAAFVAADPSLRRARALSALWRRVRPADVFPISPVRAVRSLLRGEPLFPRALPPPARAGDPLPADRGGGEPAQDRGHPVRGRR